MHTSYKEFLSSGIARKEGISNHEQKAASNMHASKAVTINRDPSKDPKQNESRMRTES
jgi:hypothetical protein